MPIRRSQPKPTAETTKPTPESAVVNQQGLATATQGPKYPRPKIMVIDAPDIFDALENRGYAATSGTFGQPMAGEQESGYYALKPSASLPGYTEQEVIIADLVGPEPQMFDISRTQKPGPGVEALWISMARGLVDPRPAAMIGVRADMNRILKHGGIFILFSTARIKPGYVFARRDTYGNSLESQGSREFPADNWSLLSDLHWLEISPDSGQEMDITNYGITRDLGINKYFDSGYFNCTIAPSVHYDRWFTLATNKYGDPVAGVIAPKKGEETTAGLIFILPQLDRRSELVVDLIEHALPELRPQLFPDTEGSRWTRRAQYELPRVAALKSEIVQIEEQTRTRIGEIEQKIQEQRAAYGFLHELLTDSGEGLVHAVAATLKLLGFTDVQDADAEAKKDGESGNLREDLRIMDAPSPILVEVKGIAGLPKEASSLQVAKYLIPRMREWNRSDLRGLAIINHQRNMPALQREDENVFQADVVSNAQEQGFGLLTTWDLFRLARGFIMHGWRHEDIVELFTTSGRVRPIPAHYKLIGLIDEFWPKAAALGIRLESGTLSVGDRIAYRQSVDFIQEDITSMQIDGIEVEKAEPGDYVGVKTKLTNEQARKNVQVFKVNVRKDADGE